jgi:sterol-4alpha-carboxylate 3-dehydrogenase (decarboxylating)
LDSLLVSYSVLVGVVESNMSAPRIYKERYLVIGGAGFLGSYIVRALVDRGQAEVVVFGGAEPAPVDVIEGVSYFPGDITNERELQDCLEKVNAVYLHPDVVF